MSDGDTGTGPLAAVSVEPGDQGWTLVLTSRMHHPPETVWRGLTEPDRLRRWAPYTTDRNLSVLGDARLTMLDEGDAEPVAITVSAVERPRLLEHTWGEDTLRWELRPAPDEPGATELTLRHTTALRQDLPRMAAGWHLCLAVDDQVLAGADVPPIRGADAMNHGWQHLYDDYAVALGIPH